MIFIFIIVNFLSVSYGCVYGWPSASVIYLQAEPSPFETGPLTKTQLGWITASVFPGSIFGALFFGWLADKIGRKRCLLVAAIPMMVSREFHPVFSTSSTTSVYFRFTG